MLDEKDTAKKVKIQGLIAKLCENFVAYEIEIVARKLKRTGHT
jgi:hypothetical protein